MRLLKKAERLDGGKRIEKVIRYANSTQGGAYSGLDTLDTAAEDTRTRAYWSWRQYHQPLVFSNIDIAKNGGTSKVFDLLKTEARDAELALQDKFGSALYTAQTGDALDSLVDAVDDGTNVATYGNINRSTYTWWAGDYTAAAGALALSTMATTYDEVKSGPDVPSLIVTHESEWSSYEALLHPSVRFSPTTGGFPKIDGGFQAMFFRGTPVISDEYCTDGYKNMWSSKTPLKRRKSRTENAVLASQKGWASVETLHGAPKQKRVKTKSDTLRDKGEQRKQTCTSLTIRDLLVTLWEFFLWTLCPEKVSLAH